MKTLFATFCFGLAVCGGFLATVPSYAESQGKEWVAADLREFDDILNRDVLPLFSLMSTTVELSGSDQLKACESAKKTQAQAGVAIKAINVLNERIKAEGKDLSRFAEVNEKITDLKTLMPEMVDGICNGEVASHGYVEDFAELNEAMTLMGQYSTAISASAEARSAGDKPSACAKLKQAGAAFSTFKANLAQWKAKPSNDPDAIADLDKLDANFTESWAGASQFLATCPVS
ncbi:MULTISPECIES: hypothetical protein [Asticcacaulis]|uniref:hypothetical protein n=1 Tax=Asticcacaulis TaxID=76890 RepID=UPI001AE40376|nr:MULTISPECIES: hypothetical protein [Asticcacaulis]MBP2159572.1 hypothetical protein [Asticcacaulis solisilvae]MDR6800601.1 hypothetical protein [Asticcacaulis sp. BE141]